MFSSRYLGRMKTKNPFLTTGYAGEDTFCDRRVETARMLAAFENDRNLTLIAPGVTAKRVSSAMSSPNFRPILPASTSTSSPWKT